MWVRTRHYAWYDDGRKGDFVRCITAWTGPVGRGHGGELRAGLPRLQSARADGGRLVAECGGVFGGPDIGFGQPRERRAVWWFLAGPGALWNRRSLRPFRDSAPGGIAVPETDRRPHVAGDGPFPLPSPADVPTVNRPPQANLMSGKAAVTTPKGQSRRTVERGVSPQKCQRSVKETFFERTPLRAEAHKTDANIGD